VIDADEHKAAVGLLDRYWLAYPDRDGEAIDIYGTPDRKGWARQAEPGGKTLLPGMRMFLIWTIGLTGREADVYEL
jgi:hypothetical protein